MADRSAARLAGLAANPAAPEDVLHALSTVDSAAVRRALESREPVIAAVAEVEWQGEDEFTFEQMEWLAEHKRGEGLARSRTLRMASPELLWRCARSRQSYLRAAVASRRSLPEQIMLHLASDRDAKVRKALAGNRDAPADVLRILARDQAKGVAAALARNRNTPGDVLASLRGQDRWVAVHRNTPPEVLAGLSPDHLTRAGVAGNPNTPPRMLVDFATGRYERDVLRAACANPSLPVDTMRDLIREA